MANGNNEPEKPRRKKCPLLNEWCIGDVCAFSVEISKPMGPMVQKSQMCSFNAMVLMLSEINGKTQNPQQKKQQIILPHIKGG